MNTLPAVFRVLTFAVLSTVANAADMPDLWIMSGQSNACGRAALPGPAPTPEVTVFDRGSGQFVTAKDPLPGMNTMGVGPWVAAAQTVARSGIDVRLVGSATGGKPISFWHPGNAGHTDLMASINDAGKGAGVFLWYQGESDALSGVTRVDYVDELKQHVRRVRTQTGNPDLLAVIIQVGSDTRKGWSGYTTLREAQRQFVLQDRRAILVPALGRTLKDAVHLDNAGYRELGAEIGRALLRHRFDRTDVNWPGPVLDGAVLNSERTGIAAHFAEVEQLAGLNAADFGVIDEEGTVKCTAASAGATMVSLEFERTIRLPARLIYGFGQHPQASLTDEAGNRAPAVQLAVATGSHIEDTPTEAPNGGGVDQSR